EAQQFCGEVRKILQTGDVFLLSTDLEKSLDRTLAAYDDALGVTAAFNLNLLVRINRELGGQFDLSQFRHYISYDDDAASIVLHLQARSDHTVTVDGDFVVMFRNGETIWTESSYKFRSESV